MSDLALQHAERRQAWLDEVRATLALAWPIILTNLLQMALTTTDVIMLGRLGPDALAAGVLGANLYFAFMIFGIGLVTAVSPMIARERRRAAPFGARCAPHAAPGAVERHRNHDPGLDRPVVRRADPARARTGPRPRGRRSVATSRPCNGPSCPSSATSCMRNFIAAVERPRWGIWAGAIGFVANAFAAWCLIFGKLGFPRLELLGAGIATTFSSSADVRRARLRRASRPKIPPLSPVRPLLAAGLAALPPALGARPADRRDARLRGVDLQRRCRS